MRRSELERSALSEFVEAVAQTVTASLEPLQEWGRNFRKALLDRGALCFASALPQRRQRPSR
jgi:hypothetical protein